MKQNFWNIQSQKSSYSTLQGNLSISNSIKVLILMKNCV